MSPLLTMSEPRDSWPPETPPPSSPPGSGQPPPGYAPPGYAPPGYAPPGSAPPGYAPPGYAPPAPGYAPPPPEGAPPSGYTPPPGAVPPPQPRQATSRRDPGGLIAGVIVIGIGLFFLLGQFVPDIGRWIPLFIGLAFLAAFLARREYGFLIPGCIVAGVGVGVVLEGVVDERWSGSVVLLSIAGGFIAIWVVSRLMHAADRSWPHGPSHDAAKALWWPLIPGGILLLVALIVLVEEGFHSDLLRWWPLLLIGAGVVILLANLSRRRDPGP